ncbi:hypothetical protein BKA93DRAFT_745497 [Sparassis latifolia]
MPIIHPSPNPVPPTPPLAIDMGGSYALPTRDLLPAAVIIAENPENRGTAVRRKDKDVETKDGVGGRPRRFPGKRLFRSDDDSPPLVKKRGSGAFASRSTHLPRRTPTLHWPLRRRSSAPALKEQKVTHAVIPGAPFDAEPDAVPFHNEQDACPSDAPEEDWVTGRMKTNAENPEEQPPKTPQMNTTGVFPQSMRSSRGSVTATPRTAVTPESVKSKLSEMSSTVSGKMVSALGLKLKSRQTEKSSGAAEQQIVGPSETSATVKGVKRKKRKH